MVHGLAAPAADVDHEPAAGVGDALASGDVGRSREQSTEDRRVAVGGVLEGVSLTKLGSRAR